MSQAFTFLVRIAISFAAVLQWAAKDNDFSAKLMAELKIFLVRDADRALFGLPLRNSEKPD
jgi:hypothetical protein